MVKTSVCWVITRSFKGIHILKIESIISFNRDMKYPLEISFMGTSYSGPATLVKSLLKYIFIEIRFHKYE